MSLPLTSSSLMLDHFSILRQSPKASKFVSEEFLTGHKIAIGATAAVVTAAVAYLATQSFSSTSKASEAFCLNSALKHSPLLSICLPQDRPEPATCEPLSFLYLAAEQPNLPKLAGKIFKQYNQFTKLEKASEFFSTWTQYLFSSPIKSNPVQVASSTILSYLNNTAVNNTTLPTCLPEAHNPVVKKAIKDVRTDMNMKEVGAEQPEQLTMLGNVSILFDNATQCLFSSPIKSNPVQVASSTAPFYFHSTVINNTILPTCLPQTHSAEQQPLTPVEKAIQAFRDTLQIEIDYWEGELIDCKSGEKRGWLSSLESCARIQHRLNCLNDKAVRAIQEQTIRTRYAQTWGEYLKQVLEMNFRVLPSLPNLLGIFPQVNNLRVILNRLISPNLYSSAIR